MLKYGPAWEHDRVSTAPAAEAPFETAQEPRQEQGEDEDRTDGKVAQPGTFGPQFATIDRMATLEHPAESRAGRRASSDRDEAELVRRAQLGSSTAFEQLVLLRGPQLYRYLAVRLHDETDALDALQETLTAAWQGLPRLKQPAKFWPWLCGIASNKAADTARARLRTTDDEIEVEARALSSSRSAKRSPPYPNSSGRCCCSATSSGSPGGGGAGARHPGRNGEVEERPRTQGAHGGLVMTRKRDEFEEQNIERALREIGEAVDPPGEEELPLSRGRQLRRPRPGSSGGPRRRGLSLRLGWTAAATAVALLVGSGLGFGVGNSVTPAVQASTTCTGTGFLPAQGWNVMQCGTVTSGKRARPSRPTSRFSRTRSRMTLPEHGVLIHATFTTAATR